MTRIIVAFQVQDSSEPDGVETAMYLDGSLAYMLEVGDDARRIASYSILRAAEEVAP